VNSEEKQVFEKKGSAPVFWQDKQGSARLSAASGQPLTRKTPALKETKSNQARKHSTKRQTVFAGGWIDTDITDTYINSRKRQTRDSQGKEFSRSKIIAMMLKERAIDDTFQKSQSILMPLIQETMRREFRIHNNRYLAIEARIAYQIGWILGLLRRFISLVLVRNAGTFEQYDNDSETDAREFVTERPKEIIEVEDRLKTKLEGMPSV
jgi:hypothetical protein